MAELTKKISYNNKSFEVHLMPDEHIKTVLSDYAYTQEEFDLIQKGLYPEAMEDKWIIHFEDNMLYFYRSWTGLCIYTVEFFSFLHREKPRYGIKDITINRNKDQYGETDDFWDASLVYYMITSMLLGIAEEPPDRGHDVDDERKALELWSLFGRHIFKD